MTIIKLTNGKELKVRGSVEEIINAYNEKPNTIITESRTNNNKTIWIDGKNIGEIQC